MFNKLFSLFGFDVQQHIQRAKAHVRDLTRDVTDHIKSEARGVALQVALGTIGIILGLISFVVFLIGIYRWIEIQYNSYEALVAVGGGTALLALVFLFVATRKKHPEPRVLEEDIFTTPPVAPIVTVATAPYVGPIHTLDIHGSLSNLLAELLRQTPQSGTPLDSILTQVTGRAAAASGETVNLAADLIRTGSRKAMFGVLGASVFVGWFLSRKTSLLFNKPSSRA